MEFRLFLYGKFDIIHHSKDMLFFGNMTDYAKENYLQMRGKQWIRKRLYFIAFP